MWPVLTPAELLHDLFGSPRPDRPGRRRRCSPRTSAPRSYRPRAERGRGGRAGPHDDVPLLDEARALLGPQPAAQAARARPPTTRSAPTATSSSTRRRTSRRCSCGCSAPLAQRLDDGGGRHRPVHRRLGPRRLGRGARAPARPPPRPARRAHHRLPPPRSEHGAGRHRCWRWPRPTCARRRSVRQDGDEPRFVAAEPGRPRRAAVVAAALEERDAVDPGSVAVIVPDSLVGPVADALRRRRRRVRPGGPQRPQQPDHARAGQPREGPRARRLRGGRAGRHPRGGGAGRPRALRRPHPRHQAPRARARAPAPAILVDAPRDVERSEQRATTAATASDGRSEPCSGQTVTRMRWRRRRRCRRGGRRSRRWWCRRATRR